MDNPFHYMKCYLLGAAVIFAMALHLTSDATADSVIRIFGDKSTKVRDNANEPAALSGSPRSDAKGSSTIRIIGDKQTGDQKSDNAPEAGGLAEQEQLGQRLVALKAEEERKAAENEQRERVKTEQENKAAEAARQAAARKQQELREARKAEESRKSAEKEREERLAAFKADDERHRTLVGVRSQPKGD